MSTAAVYDIDQLVDGVNVTGPIYPTKKTTLGIPFIYGMLLLGFKPVLSGQQVVGAAGQLGSDLSELRGFAGLPLLHSPSPKATTNLFNFDTNNHHPIRWARR